MFLYFFPSNLQPQCAAIPIMLKLTTLWAFSSLALCASAASFPPKPEGITVVESKKFPGVSISYKEVIHHLPASYTRILTYPRPAYARLPLASKALAAMSTSHPTLHSIATTKATCTSGSSKPDKTPPTHHYPSGSRVVQECHLPQQQSMKTDLATFNLTQRLL